METETPTGLSQSDESPSGFEIDGERYEVPRLENLDLDEEQILYDVAGIVQADFAPAHPQSSEETQLAVLQGIAEKVRNPAFKRALAHIAYRRRHPDESFTDISLVVGKINALDSEIALIRGDGSPPTTSSPNELESDETSSEPSRSSASGRPSGSTSDGADGLRVITGTGRSDTSSQESLPTTLAASE